MSVTQKKCRKLVALLVVVGSLIGSVHGQGIDLARVKCVQFGYKADTPAFEECVKQYLKASGSVGNSTPLTNASVAPTAPTPRTSAVPQSAQSNTDTREDKFWDDAMSIGNREAYQAYLDRYPNGRYVPLANAQIIGFKKAQDEAGRTQVPRQREFQDCPECPSMIIIPGGVVDMGSASGEAESEAGGALSALQTIPRHPVSIKGFAVSRHEITRKQFRQFVLESLYRPNIAAGCHVYQDGTFVHDVASNWENTGFSQDDDHPVVCISWYEAKHYVSWLSQKTGRSYRLLSEAEWEYAARAGTSSRRYWGDDPHRACSFANGADATAKQILPGYSYSVANCFDGYAYTAPVGRFAANSFGLFDMLGNVWEMVEDCENRTYAQAPGDGSAWDKGDCARRIGRGGAWFNAFGMLRSAARGSGDLYRRSVGLGFRVAASE